MPPPAPMVVWHAGRAKMDRPTLAGRVAGDSHANSGLGIFCATRADEYITSFGTNIYKLTLRNDLRVQKITVPELMRMAHVGRDRAWFEQEGRRLGVACDALGLVELDGRVDQIVILRDDAIVACEKVAVEQFLALCRGSDKSLRGTRRGP